VNVKTVKGIVSLYFKRSVVWLYIYIVPLPVFPIHLPSSCTLVWVSQPYLYFLHSLALTLFIPTTATTQQQPLFTANIQINLCQPAPPVENWRILLVQSFRPTARLPLLMATRTFRLESSLVFSLFISLVYTARCYASAVLAMGLCLVCLSVRHKSEFC